MQLHIGLLGPFKVLIDGVEVTQFESVKVRALLAYLAAEVSKPHSRAFLAGLLWPDWPEEAAHKNLRHTLSRLRKDIQEDKSHQPFIRADRSQITFDPDEDCEIDTLELSHYLLGAAADPTNRATIEKLEDVVSQARGAFLDGFLLDDSPKFEEWILNMREYHSQQLLKAHNILCHWYEENKAYEQAELYARRQLELEPWSEAVHQQLMRLLAKEGNRSQALKQYERLESELREALDVGPSQETLQLVEQIKAGQFEQTTGDAFKPASEEMEKRHHNLPGELTSFIGREKEIEEVSALLSEHRLVTLTGVSGTGKSRLALRIARTMLTDYPNGIWLLELASLTDPGLILRTLLTALDLQESPQQGIIDQLKAYLHQRNILIILDNCEHVITECARVSQELLLACPDLKILATSREALGIIGEFTYHVPSLSIPDISKLPPLGQLVQNPSVKLFFERARAVKTGFSVTQGNAKEVAQICKRLDGIPLAIELAAARVSALSPAQIAAHLDDRFRLLTGGARTALPRQQTLQASIDWSYSLLAETERLLLIRLSVFQGGWTLELAQSVCGFNGLDAFGVMDGLAQLVNKSLIIADTTEDGSTRYHRLETIRQYAREKLLDSGDSEVLYDRHLDAFLDLAEEAKPHLRRRRHLEWLDRLDVELDNLRVALSWALEHDVEKGLHITTSLHWFWHCRNYHVEGENWLRKLQTQAKEKDIDVNPVLLAEVLARQSLLLFIINWPVRIGFHLAEEALKLASEFVGDHKHVYALALNAMVWSTEDLESKRWGQQLLEIAEEIGDTFLIAESMNGLFWSESDHVKAKSYVDRKMSLSRELGDDDGLMSSYLYLGHYHLYLKEYPLAIQMYEQSIELARKLGHRNYLIRGLSNLGSVYYGLSETFQATESYQKGLEVALEFGNPSDVVFLYSMLGYVDGLKRDWFAAREQIQRAIEIARENRLAYWETYALFSLAEVAWSLDRTETARESYQKVSELGYDQLDTKVLIFYASGMASLLNEDLLAAEGFFLEALISYSKEGHYFGMSECLQALSLCEIYAGHYDKAIRLFGVIDSTNAKFFTGMHNSLFIQDAVNEALKRVHSALDEIRYAELLQEGQAVQVENVMAYVQEVLGE